MVLFIYISNDKNKVSKKILKAYTTIGIIDIHRENVVFLPKENDTLNYIIFNTGNLELNLNTEYYKFVKLILSRSESYHLITSFHSDIPKSLRDRARVVFT